MRKNCIIIGGCGFIGLNLAKGLLSCGHKVTIVDKNPIPLSFWGSPKEVHFYKMNYRNLKALGAILKKQEILFHLACSSFPGAVFDKIEKDIEDNVLSPLGLFRLAVKNGVKKIVFPSSGGTVYGVSDSFPIKEDFPTNPICFHGITKLMIEKYLLLLNRMFGVDYLVYRISNLYGPGQSPAGEYGLIANVLGRISKGLPIKIFGDGENVRDYIYIDDAVNAFVLGIDNGLKNDIFNIGTARGLSINMVIKIISKVTNLAPKIVHLKKRPIDVRTSILDIDKAKHAIGWKPEVSIEQGIRETYQWIRGLNFKYAERKNNIL